MMFTDGVWQFKDIDDQISATMTLITEVTVVFSLHASCSPLL